MPKTEVKKKKKSFTFSRKVSTLDIVLSIKYLAVMLRSSLAIEDALEVLSQQSNSQKLKDTYKEIAQEVHKGEALSSSMAKYPKVFPEIVVHVVEAGEEGARLEKNLIYLADYLKNDYLLKKKIKGALFYPIAVLLLTVMEFTGVIFFIIPKLQALFSSFATLPPLTKFILTSTTFIRTNILFIILGFILLSALVRYFFKSKRSRKLKSRVALGFPIVKKLTKSMILANFSRTLSILLESGIPISKALKISVKTVGNSLYADVLSDVQQKLVAGNTLAQSLKEHKKYFTDTFTKMIEVGEDTGTLEENLLYLHEFYAEEVDDMSKNLTTLLEPILLVFIGLMVGMLAIAIVGPIYQLTGQIGK